MVLLSTLNKGWLVALKKSLLMFVYNDLNKDARVQRAALALSEAYVINVISIGAAYSTEEFTNTTIELDGKNKYYKYIFFMYSIVKQFKKYEYEYVYAHDYYSTLPLILIKVLAIFRNIKMKSIYDIHEFMVPVRAENRTVRARVFYCLELMVLNFVDQVICPEKSRAKLAKACYKLNALPKVIRNISCISASMKFYNDRTELLLKDFFKDNKRKTIVYAGVISFDRKLEELINSLSGANIDIKILVVGNGNARDDIERRLSESGMQYLIIDMVPFTRLYSILSRCDIGYLSYPNNSLNNKYCAPNKIYEYCSVGLPIMLNANHTIDSYIRKWGIGRNGSDFKNSVRDILKNYEIYRHNCSIFIEENLWSEEAKLLLEIVDSIE